MPRSMPATMRETDSSSTPASSMETVANPIPPLSPNVVWALAGAAMTMRTTKTTSLRMGLATLLV